jgi:uncharacterized membrane protein YbhN (UPF0104 family)
MKKTPSVWQWLWWALQLVVAGVVAWMIWIAVARNWGQFRSMRLSITPRPGWLALSVLVILMSFASSVEAWRRILGSWSQHLRFLVAARIWLLANLGRYIPGKVWSVAGLVVLAQRAGVAPWAAAASAVAIQAVAIGTAVAIVAAATPGAASPVRLAAAALIAVATIAVLAWKRAATVVAGLVGIPQIQPLSLAAVAQSASFGLLSWVAHGAAFWLLARGLGLPGSLPLGTAVGAFTLGYVLGLVALFAPGGVGVREVVLISLLTPAVGAGGAVAWSLASRIELTLAEAGAGLVAALMGRRK